MRNLASILSKLLQALNNNFDNTDEANVKNLKNRIAQVLPSLCLTVEFEFDENVWEMTTEAFAIKVQRSIWMFAQIA